MANDIQAIRHTLMADLVSLFTNPGESIADPFMGSGTTGVAAIQLGRSFCGIEKNAAHFSAACRRIEQAANQGQLFTPPAAQPQQLGLEAS